MAYRLAKSLEKMREQINAKWPTRSKASDGWIGDAAHASRSSDHNPWVKDGSMGIVTALDITHDPACGLDANKLARWLVERQDPRLKYVISNRKIASREKGWTWRDYNGSNPHTKHVHVSVMPDKPLYDDASPWGVRNAPASKPAKKAQPTIGMPVLKQGDSGPAVATLQNLLELPATGIFDAATTKAVQAFQTTHGLASDGIVGAYTWDALNKTMSA